MKFNQQLIERLKNRKIAMVYSAISDDDQPTLKKIIALAFPEDVVFPHGMYGIYYASKQRVGKWAFSPFPESMPAKFHVPFKDFII